MQRCTLSGQRRTDSACVHTQSALTQSAYAHSTCRNSTSIHTAHTHTQRMHTYSLWHTLVLFHGPSPLLLGSWNTLHCLDNWCGQICLTEAETCSMGAIISEGKVESFEMWKHQQATSSHYNRRLFSGDLIEDDTESKKLKDVSLNWCLKSRDQL